MGTLYFKSEMHLIASQVSEVNLSDTIRNPSPDVAVRTHPMKSYSGTYVVSTVQQETTGCG